MSATSDLALQPGIIKAFFYTVGSITLRLQKAFAAPPGTVQASKSEVCSFPSRLCLAHVMPMCSSAPCPIYYPSSLMASFNKFYLMSLDSGLCVGLHEAECSGASAQFIMQRWESSVVLLTLTAQLQHQHSLSRFRHPVCHLLNQFCHPEGQVLGLIFRRLLG